MADHRIYRNVEKNEHIFVAFVCSIARVALLVVDLSRLSQPFLLFVFNTSTRSTHCSVVSGSCKLISSLPIEFPSAHQLMFHSSTSF